MSQRLISHNADLKQLRDEGYDIAVRGSYLLLRAVPYVNSKREIAYGTLVSALSLAGDTTEPPKDHVIHFVGDHPCDEHGAQLEKIKNASETRTLDRDLVIHHSFSSKPRGGYKNHHDKFTTYAAIISAPAFALDASVTTTPFKVVEADEEDPVFNYLDTASSRAEIMAVARKLELGRVAIVGLGGTGSYILDLVAKTPVREIHLFDGDVLSQHNAFRSPGAPSVEQLRERPLKVAHFTQQYAPMRKGIVPHPYYLGGHNALELRGMDFVFISMDGSEEKRALLDELDTIGVPFVDVGMGVDHTDGSLGGILRVTTSSQTKRDHVLARIPASDTVEDEYARNIQVADLNALNAALAVIKWKKLFGFYRDLDREHHATYTIDGNLLINDDRP